MSTERLSGPFFVILSGLPGSGKTTIARELARRLGAVHLRIDTIEQAMANAGIDMKTILDVVNVRRRRTGRPVKENASLRPIWA